MADGEQRGLNASRKFNLGAMPGLLLAAAAGIIAALVTANWRQGEAAALFTINQWVVFLGELFGITNISLWMVVVGLIVMGAGLVFGFQPVTRRGAFALGFGLFAMLVLAVPGYNANGIQSVSDDLYVLEPALLHNASIERSEKNASPSLSGFGSAKTQLTLANDLQDKLKYNIHMAINFANGIPEDIELMLRRGTIRGRLHNEETNETWNLFRSQGGSIRREGDTLLIDAGVPMRRDDSVRLWVRIECVGYAIEEQSALATMEQALDWTVDLNGSNTPLIVQRLSKSYWF